jgi:hypothetical protein
VTDVLKAPEVGQVVKKRQGFVKGVSGNPTGRPKGSKNQITLLRQSLELQLREAAAPDMLGVLTKAVELAKEGDRSMIKLLLELHMSKQASEQENAVEKVEINITSSGPQTVKPLKQISVIDAEIVPK